jgi:hypothetical protein
MKYLSGYKGVIFNLVLLLMVLLLGSWLAKVNKSNMDYDMPLYIICFFTALLPFEYRANQYILASEFQKIRLNQKATWDWFTKFKVFGILLLLAVQWRTYFKMVFLILPLFIALYAWIGFDYHSLHWIWKSPVYMVGLGIFWGELVMIRHTLFPSEEKVAIQNIWWSRLVIVLLMTFFTISLQMMLRSFFNLRLEFTEMIANLPLLFIVFVFFYIPLRWIELISDVIDCENKWQLWLFWISTFVGMIVVMMVT